MGDQQSSRMQTQSKTPILATLKRGIQLSPEFAVGFKITAAFAALAVIGRLVAPLAVRHGIDDGIMAPGGPNVPITVGLAAIAVILSALTVYSAYQANKRMFRQAEAGLAALRIKAFRHVHDLSVLSQNTERRGSLVSRVTSDVDTISQFMRWSGLTLLLSSGQILVAVTVMAIFSPILAVCVLLAYVPGVVMNFKMQSRIAAAYASTRAQHGAVLGAAAESLAGADTIRAYGIRERITTQLLSQVEAFRKYQMRAQNTTASTFAFANWSNGLAVAVAVGVGAWLGHRGQLTLGELIGVLFLLQIIAGPIQGLAENISELQQALAGWRRVLAVLDTPTDIADPGEDAQPLPSGPLDLELVEVSYHYPDGPDVLRQVSLTIPAATRVAVVGETGSGKSTLAKLLTRLQDPTNGSVNIGGVALDRVSFADLRQRMVMVPQEGFLFDQSILENIQYAGDHITVDMVDKAVDDLGLREWVEGLSDGLHTHVGQRGESLSAGERQLVALLRTHVVNPDVLVMDEATSAVDPATEVRVQRALLAATEGRTCVTIAHRLSTAQAADLVVVVDDGEVAQVGPHDDLVLLEGPYRRMFASWIAGTGEASATPVSARG